MLGRNSGTLFFVLLRPRLVGLHEITQEVDIGEEARRQFRAGSESALLGVEKVMIRVLFVGEGGMKWCGRLDEQSAFVVESLVCQGRRVVSRGSRRTISPLLVGRLQGFLMICAPCCSAKSTEEEGLEATIASCRVQTSTPASGCVRSL